MIHWLLSLVKRPVAKTIVLFDGDQGITPFQQLYKKLEHVEYTWIQNSKMTTPKIIKKSGVRIIVPSDIGKESVDNYISMLVGLECSKPNPPKRVVIVSRDMDFIDVIINASALFTNISFTLMAERRGGRATKKNPKLPVNASIIRFKERQPT